MGRKSKVELEVDRAIEDLKLRIIKNGDEVFQPLLNEIRRVHSQIDHYNPRREVEQFSKDLQKLNNEVQQISRQVRIIEAGAASIKKDWSIKTIIYAIIGAALGTFLTNWVWVTLL